MSSSAAMIEPTLHRAAEPSPQDRAVLLIDDDQSLLHGLARALHHQPYWVYTATSGEEAMRIVKGRRIDVVVVDEHMPGMCGGDILAWIADHCPEVMRIVLTGNPTVESMIHAINEGRVYQYFTKPCNPAHLGVAIRRAMEHKESLDTNRRLSSGQDSPDECDSCRAELRALRTLITENIQGPLQAILVSRAPLETGVAPLDSRTRTLVDQTLVGLVKVKRAVNELMERKSTHE